MQKEEVVFRLEPGLQLRSRMKLILQKTVTLCVYLLLNTLAISVLVTMHPGASKWFKKGKSRFLLPQFGPFFLGLTI